jgi:hypothetical protein
MKEYLGQLYVLYNAVRFHRINTLQPPSSHAVDPAASSLGIAAVFGGPDGDSPKSVRAKLRAERKIHLDGGGGIGPARQARDHKRGGKPRDALVDNLVLEFDERKAGANDPKIVVYCIGCDKSTVGRDPNRIKKHAKDCNVHLSVDSWSHSSD